MAAKYQVSETFLRATTPTSPLYQVADVSLIATPTPVSVPVYQVAEAFLSASTTANVKWWDGSAVQSGRFRLHDGTAVVSL